MRWRYRGGEKRVGNREQPQCRFCETFDEEFFFHRSLNGVSSDGLQKSFVGIGYPSKNVRQEENSQMSLEKKQREMGSERQQQRHIEKESKRKERHPMPLFTIADKGPG